MTKRTRQNHTPAFKAKVALAAVQGNETLPYFQSLEPNTYVVLGTLLQPALWADPLGPLIKIAPIVVLNLVALAILDDR